MVLAARTHLPRQETKETRVQALGQEDPLEEGVATHSSILAWRIPWTEEPGGLRTVHGFAKSQTRPKRFSTHGGGGRGAVGSQGPSAQLLGAIHPVRSSPSH